MIRALSSPELEISAKRLHRKRSNRSPASVHSRVSVRTNIELIDKPKRSNNGKKWSYLRRRTNTPELSRSKVTVSTDSSWNIAEAVQRPTSGLSISANQKPSDESSMSASRENVHAIYRKKSSATTTPQGGKSDSDDHYRSTNSDRRRDRGSVSDKQERKLSLKSEFSPPKAVDKNDLKLDLKALLDEDDDNFDQDRQQAVTSGDEKPPSTILTESPIDKSNVDDIDQIDHADVHPMINSAMHDETPANSAFYVDLKPGVEPIMQNESNRAESIDRKKTIAPVGGSPVRRWRTGPAPTLAQNPVLSTVLNGRKVAVYRRNSLQNQTLERDDRKRNQPSSDDRFRYDRARSIEATPEPKPAVDDRSINGSGRRIAALNQTGNERSSLINASPSDRPPNGRSSPANRSRASKPTSADRSKRDRFSPINRLDGNQSSPVVVESRRQSTSRIRSSPVPIDTIGSEQKSNPVTTPNMQKTSPLTMQKSTEETDKEQTVPNRPPIADSARSERRNQKTSRQLTDQQASNRSQTEPVIDSDQLHSVKAYLDQQSKFDRSRMSNVKDAIAQSARGNGGANSDLVTRLTTIIERIIEEKMLLTQICAHFLGQLGLNDKNRPVADSNLTKPTNQTQPADKPNIRHRRFSSDARLPDDQSITVGESPTAGTYRQKQVHQDEIKSRYEAKIEELTSVILQLQKASSSSKKSMSDGYAQTEIESIISDRLTNRDATETKQDPSASVTETKPNQETLVSPEIQQQNDENPVSNDDGVSLKNSDVTTNMNMSQLANNPADISTRITDLQDENAGLQRQLSELRQRCERLTSAIVEIRSKEKPETNVGPL